MGCRARAKWGFADPSDRVSRTLLADSYEQLGYQSESAIWRNIYLTGARELRRASPDRVAETGPNYLMMATPLADFLDLVETTLVPEKAGETKLAFNISDTTTESGTSRWFGKCCSREQGASPLPGAPTLSAAKPIILGVLFGQAKLNAMVASGRARLTGDGSQIQQLVGRILEHAQTGLRNCRAVRAGIQGRSADATAHSPDAIWLKMICSAHSPSHADLLGDLGQAKKGLIGLICRGHIFSIVSPYPPFLDENFELSPLLRPIKTCEPIFC